MEDLAGPDIIKFGIESKVSCPETSSDDFWDAISSALQQMRSVIQDHPECASESGTVLRSRL